MGSFKVNNGDSGGKGCGDDYQSEGSCDGNEFEQGASGKSSHANPP